MNINKNYTKFSKEISLVLIANVCTSLFAFIQLAVLTKWLGVNLYGIWSVINVTIMLIVPIASLSFGASIIRFLSIEKNKLIIKEDFSSSFSTILIFGFILLITLCFFSDYIAINVLKNVNYSFYIKLASILIILISLHSLTVAFLRTFRKIKLYSTLTVIQYLSQVILICFSLLLNFKLTGVIISFIINWFLFTAINFFIIYKEVGFQLPKFTRSKIYLKYGIPLIPNFGIMWVISLSDRYIISYFLDNVATGIYSAAYILSNQAGFLLGAITVVLFPAISKSFDEQNIKETKNYLKYSLKYFFLFSIPATFGLWILAKPILQIFTTTKFLSGEIIIPFIALGSIFGGLFQICIYIVHLVKKTYLTIRLLTISAVLNIVLNIILIPRMGIIGAAIATLISYGILGLLTLMVTRKYLSFSIDFISLIKSVIASIIMSIFLWLIQPWSIISLLLSILLGSIIYFTVIILIKGLGKKELIFIRNLIKNHLITK